ncbi:choline transporter-like protein 1 isoform X2 [Eriocheir sinensis]|uniref:choline transporter-like protein 1 isoform X2 n=1 Tax=Eriocheir sinensis TaxID=95602 RepID=UPI0021C90235|nr:choline transporter-like protein 1 isoform X2 [Eriocheir sinensis]
MTRARSKVNGKVLAPPGGEEHFTGPLHDRVCRDVLFLILFVAFVFGAIGYIVYTGIKSDPKRLLNGHDAYGNVCGRKNQQLFALAKSGQNFENMPFCNMKGAAEVITQDPTTIAPCKSCVDRCPTDSSPLGYYCTNLNFNEAQNRTNIATKAIFGTSLSEFLEAVGRDLEVSGSILAVLAVIAFGLALIFTLLLRFLARVVVWLTVIVMVVGSVAGTAYLWVIWNLTNKNAQEARKNNSSSADYLDLFARNLLIGAIVATIFTVLMLVLLIAMRNRIKLVIALFTEAGKAVGSMPLLLFQPVWTCLWLGIVCLVWVSAWALIATAGEPKKEGDGVVFILSPFIKHMRWYHLFALLWVTQFILASQDVIIAGSVAQWYFTRDKKMLGWPILTATKRLYRYHLGSVAFGSLLIAIVKFIRIIFKYFEKRLQGTNNEFCTFCLKCCQCCLWCFEKFLKFLSRNAYIEIAIYGYSFCKAAQKAFSLLVNNALRVAAINSVGAFVLLLTKLAIVAVTVAIGYFILRTKHELTYLWVPLLVTAVFSYFIAHCFISVYEMCIDTLFLCFCEDCERNDGIERPYFMNRGLMAFVENNRKALEALDERQAEQRKASLAQRQASSAIRPSTTTSTRLDSSGGMTPLKPAYPPTSRLPSPAHYMTPTGA